ncbi:hypothetical protein LDL08_05140 [Nonomuraea glycinis]|uniref:Uncharacterized protein n=1 Tax=Nonomuraea glycinis TaxID=2047744 RepID=A0A918A437_9ACTN|nr:hypothetical protein [Nonomuraea glycinis]MCA2175565.1 hypothetical protein [Nonomuraea glycinis]GGP04932.1 hypothetical protein GCM10012278_22320 [Nonomuraea glycinis]
MKRRVRSLLATATGVAVLFGGAGLTTTGSAYAAQHALTTGPDFMGDVSASAYVPVQGEAGASVTLKLRDPATVRRVTGVIAAPGKPDRPVTFDFERDAVITGKWTIGERDPAGRWKLTVNVVRQTTQVNDFTVKVAGKQRITSASVTPDPVALVRGKDVKVLVESTIEGSGMVSAKLVSDRSSQYYDLGNLALEPGGRHRGTAYFGDDSTAGAWTLEIYATRGGEVLKGVSPFTVKAAAQGASGKAGARVTIGAAKKVRKGAYFKVYGRAYRGAKPYANKKLKIHFKAKGGSTYKLVAFVRTNRSGRYAKSLKAGADGYFRVTSPGTRATRAALSPQRLVDVR